MRKAAALLFAVLIPVAASRAGRPAPGSERYAVAREGPFEFASKPAVTRDGDTVTVEFETKGFCDVTVAVEDKDGRIVRHWASGVLGDNAPPPFQQNAKKQTVIWDGKDDAGVYVDDKDSLTVRVSLGLKPRYERILLWSPYLRFDSRAPIIVPSAEGVFVYQGTAIDMVTLHRRNGDYARTVYPFPADKLGGVLGLPVHTYPQDGLTLPLKQGYHRATLLPGRIADGAGAEHFTGGYSATAMAAHRSGRIALARHSLHRLRSDGTTGGLPLQGPKTEIRIGRDTVFPHAAAFCPDGRWLYLTAYKWQTAWNSSEALHGVWRLDYEQDGDPELFAGQMTREDFGDGPDRFCVPSDVACDARGRVYVADYLNDRVQIFSPDGRLLRSLRVSNPARVQILEPTQAIAVFSFPEGGAGHSAVRWRMKQGWTEKNLSQSLTLFGPFEAPGEGKVHPLPFPVSRAHGVALRLALDPWADTLALWAVSHKTLPHETMDGGFARAAEKQRAADTFRDAGIRLYAWRNGAWAQQRDFAADAAETVRCLRPSDFGRQRLYVNPSDGWLYVGKDRGLSKAMNDLIGIEPATGRVRIVPLPFQAEDVAFDREGHIYLRCSVANIIVRFDFRTWREVPWDYGETRGRFHGALPTPGHRPGHYHLSGIGLNTRGDLVFGHHVSATPPARNPRSAWADGANQVFVTRPYAPFVYPGRSGNWVCFVVDRHGKMIREDALPGMTQTHHLQMDDARNLYALVQGRRVYDGRPYFEQTSGTLIRFGIGGGNKTMSSERARVPMSDGLVPDRPPDLQRYEYGDMWTEDAHWMYGGVGHVGPAQPCTCFNSRFALDFLRRSFVPETLRYRVAVLDANGNLVARIGQYGNAESAGPDSPIPLGTSTDSRLRKEATADAAGQASDEVGLFHPAYVATHTDRRLFIHDFGNQRIVSVALGYHAEERVALKNVPDKAAGRQEKE